MFPLNWNQQPLTLLEKRTMREKDHKEKRARERERDREKKHMHLRRGKMLKFQVQASIQK